jgi:triosephosphate isomerase
MNKLLIANWKMNPSTESEATKLAKATDAEGVVVCPPYPFLSAVHTTLKKARIGAQDISWQERKDSTGEVSGFELKSFHVEYVIIGHSERRIQGETDEVVAKKLAAAIASGITPILCIGETLEEKEAGKTREVVDRQLRTAVSLIPADIGDAKSGLLIAYEPVWAISTNQSGESVTAVPEDARGVIHYMQGIVRGIPLTIQFLYGGSVNAKNLKSFLDIPEVAGVLVGGASLKPAEFKKMVTIADEVNNIINTH